MQSQWQKFIFEYAQTHNLSTQYDAQWPSPCLAGNPDNPDAYCDGDWVAWQPVARAPEPMSDFTQALGIALTPEITDFYSACFADNLSVHIPEGQVTLLQAWNADDYARLKENLIGHVLMKRRLKQPETVFIGLPENDSYLISVELDSGHVVLEPVGKPAEMIIATNFSEFLSLIS
mgnify:FL=1